MNHNPLPDRDDTPSRIAWWALVCAVAALLVALAALLVGLRDHGGAEPTDNGETAAATTPTVMETPSIDTTVVEPPVSEPPTPEPPGTLTSGPTTTPPPLPSALPDDVSQAIWPSPGSSIRYTGPVAAAEGFAVDFVGFDPLIVGDFMAADNRSGDVEIRSRPEAAPTIVHVRQLDDESWSVIGASNANLTVTHPAALAEIASPLVLTGQARAFEGTVQVRLYSDGSSEPVVSGFVTGSGGPEPGPFTEVFQWNTTTSAGATLLLFWTSPVDGSVEEAAAVRLRFGDVPV